MSNDREIIHMLRGDDVLCHHENGHVTTLQENEVTCDSCITRLTVEKRKRENAERTEKRRRELETRTHNELIDLALNLEDILGATDINLEISESRLLIAKQHIVSLEADIQIALARAIEHKEMFEKERANSNMWFSKYKMANSKLRFINRVLRLALTVEQYEHFRKMVGS